MNPTDPDKVKRIIQLWFEGQTGKTIAVTENTSEGNVSAIINTLPPSLQAARDLVVKLRKSNKTIADASKGIDIAIQLESLGLTPIQIPIFLEVIQKTSTKAGYQPKEVIQASIKLANLEKQSGDKTYSETLKAFQTMTQQIPELKQEKSQLLLDIQQNKEKLKQNLKKAKLTEKEITQINKLKSELHYYGTNLLNAEALLDYLNNMNETGLSPKKFVSFTKKIGSIEQHINDLNEKKQTTIEALDLAKQQIELKKTELLQLKIEHGVFMAKADQEQKSIMQTIAKEDKKLEKAKIDVDAANTQLCNLRSAIQQAENRQQEVINETKKTLIVKNYALEHKFAIAALETKHRVLEDQVNALSSKIEFATTITDFLTTQSDYYFDQFYATVQQIKKIRKNPNSASKPNPKDLTETMKINLLQAILGITRFEALSNLMYEKTRMQAEIAQLKLKVFQLEKDKTRKTTP